MLKSLSRRVLSALACPYCNQNLKLDHDHAACGVCGERFATTEHGQLDFRLAKSKRYSFECQVGPRADPPLEFAPLRKNPAAAVDFSGIASTRHMPEILRSYIPASKNGDLMLNLGCGGDAAPRIVAERAGYECVSFDVANPNADFLGDAHAIPLKDQSVGLVVSIAVLQYIRHPAVMMREVRRVLRPGGKFIGTVAFLEPYTKNACYHYTHLGVLTSLQDAGFDVEAIAPSAEWDALAAQSRMLFFPKAPRWFALGVVVPLRWVHKAWWRLGSLMSKRPDATEKNRILYGTGAFTFIASRPGS